MYTQVSATSPHSSDDWNHGAPQEHSEQGNGGYRYEQHYQGETRDEPSALRPTATQQPGPILNPYVEAFSAAPQSYQPSYSSVPMALSPETSAYPGPRLEYGFHPMDTQQAGSVRFSDAVPRFYSAAEPLPLGMSPVGPSPFAMGAAMDPGGDAVMKAPPAFKYANAAFHPQLPPYPAVMGYPGTPHVPNAFAAAMMRQDPGQPRPSDPQNRATVPKRFGTTISADWRRSEKRQKFSCWSFKDLFAGWLQ